VKKFSIASLLVALVIAGVGMFSAGPASASSTEASAQRAGCVTRAEYRAVRKGWKQTAVHAKFGTVGKRFTIASSGGYVFEVRTYDVCGSQFSVVSIGYDKNPGGVLRLSNKTAVWVG
jgi:hypothetical protein